MNARPDPRFAPIAAALCFANFAAVTTEFIVPGILLPIATDLGVPIGAASRLVSSFALAAGLAGPLLAAACARLPARTLLLAAMLVFAAANMVMACASDLAALVAARIVQGCILPALVSVSSTSLAGMAGPRQTGKAVAILYLGVTGASVLGVPAGALVAEVAHWRAAFAGLTVFCFASALLVWLLMPATGRPPARTGAAPLHMIRSANFLGHLALSTLLFTAMFCGYTYLPAYLEQSAGLGGRTVGALLLAFGLAGAAGNMLGGRFADRRPFEAAAVAAAVLAGAMATLPLAATSMPLLLVLIACWGMGHASIFVLNQVRVMRAGDQAAGLAASLNISACNLGISLGAAAGAWALACHGPAAPAVLAAGLALGASAASMVARVRR